MNSNKQLPAQTRLLKKVKSTVVGYLYIAPIMLGILLFTMVPMFTSLYYSFFDFKIFDNQPSNFGFQNYIKPFTTDWDNFGNSLSVTFVYTIIGLPVGMVLSFSLALFLNKDIFGIKVFRVIYYIPVLIPAVVSGLLWSDLTDYNIGFFNTLFTKLGWPKYGFYSMPETVLPTLIFMGLFSIGGGMILWIAQLKGIPETLYEASRLEGAGFWTNTFRITIPMCTPMIFYNLITGIIGSLQTFAGAFMLITPANSEQLDFIVVRIYNTAFGSMDMGYACALSWLLFLLIAVLSAVVFKTSRWVFYGEEN